MKGSELLQAGEPVGASVQCPTNSSHRILVVEDDLNILQLNTGALIRFGYDVDAVEDGAVAWEALNTDGYDLMITDNKMPRLNGIELLKKLYASRMALPVIMATGELPTEEFTRYPWLQPAATLLKPYTIAELLETVKQVLREVDGADDGSQLFKHRGRKDNKMSPAGEPASAPQPRPANFPRRILVADEDSDLRLLYTEALASPGYRVDAAKDGAAGWESLQTHNYNLLITEHSLPRLTGVELVKKMRAARMAVPVVMATVRLSTQELAIDPSLQLAAMLPKPFYISELLETVKVVLRATDSSREQIAVRPNWRSQPVTVGLLL